MTISLLADAFGHHVWATLTLLDAIADLTPEQMETNMPGTYGSIRETTQHLVGSDCSYLFVLGGGSRGRIDEETINVAQLRAEMELNGPAWTEVLDEEIDPEETLIRYRDERLLQIDLLVQHLGPGRAVELHFGPQLGHVHRLLVDPRPRNRRRARRGMDPTRCCVVSRMLDRGRVPARWSPSARGRGRRWRRAGSV